MRDRWAGLGQRPEPSRRRESRAPPGTWFRELFLPADWNGRDDKDGSQFEMW